MTESELSVDLKRELEAEAAEVAEYTRTEKDFFYLLEEITKEQAREAESLINLISDD